MNYYFDIIFQPDEEVPVYFIRNKAYNKLHKTLYDLDVNDIGVSFPKVKIKLGNMIRIHSTKNSLSKLQNTNWLGGLSGYCKITEIQPIPDNVKYRTVSRKQANMTAAKLRRLIKRGSISEEEAKKYRARMFSQGLDNPYLELDSTSNGHKHRRYIEFGGYQESPVTGEFDQFGLSKTTTVPWF
ncbi:MAG: type I-F CRISPR-associated endoribonuclease Cas6/Csy4 [gamma proteobacterium symbiont of Taylorina sp.]|nr:type I-F CRISPR-associated endoribonuclease Cas6/Csy4 [gamma proteobacterium symbiont of Taylorina sp.]